jgi:hypothetical protein
MTFTLTPHLGADILRFGMSRSAIRAQLAETPTQFLRAEVEDTDYYPSVGLFVIYQEGEICVALEFTRPARVLLSGISLLPLSKKKALALFHEDATLTQDDAGWTSYQQGIGAYYEESRRAETIIAFSPGYYEASML